MSASNARNPEVRDLGECKFCESLEVDEDGYCASCGLLREGGDDVAVEPVALTAGEIMAKLVVPDKSAGEGLSRAIDLPEGVYTVGRSDADIVVHDPYLSRLHADVSVNPTGIVVTDRGSTNGTFVNGSRIAPDAPVMLSNGDTLMFGQTNIEWEYLGKPQTDESTTVMEPPVATTTTEPVDEKEPATDAEAAEGDEADSGAAGDTTGETGKSGKPVWTLKCVSREHPEIELAAGRTVVGRKAGRADAVIAGDGFISSAHLSIEINDEGVFVTDLGSTNGTMVNGEKIEPSTVVKMEHGSRLRIGETELEFVCLE